MAYWLVKSEPFKYSWDQFVKDKKTFWDGVRNYAARNNLRSMQKGDLVLFYHSNEGLEIVGIAEVIKTAYQDPTSDVDTWVAVDIKPRKKFNTPVTLQALKADSFFKNLELIRLARLSVSAVQEDEFNRILVMGNTEL
jgi:predicted RNA-binding protein with PUA-like domain